MTEDTAAPATHELDAGLQDFLKSAHRVRWSVIIAVMVLLSLAVGALGYIALQEHRQLEASCAFYRDIGAAPVPLNPSKGHELSQLGVAIVVHARYTFQGQGCPGELPSASPGLVKWAAHYGLPLPAD